MGRQRSTQFCQQRVFTETTFNTPTDLGAFAIRVMQIDGNHWFVLRDVCLAIGYAVKANGAVNTSNAAAALLPAEKATGTISSLGGAQRTLQISKSGLYKLILRTQRTNPAVAQFQDWVCPDVLPAIRKDGGYVQGEEKLNDPDLNLSDLDAMNDRITALRGSPQTPLPGGPER